MPPATLSPDAAYWLVAVWLFAIGGAIGSFLNVVVFRLPAGISLINPGSHCPACRRPIRWFDNVPILGWIVLRGRCRDCGWAISVRYPIVELITAGVFLVLGLVECLGEGMNLPRRAVELPEGVAFLPWMPIQPYGIYAYHLLLLCTLLAAGLIEWDGHRPPRALFVPALVGGVLAPLMWPGLRPVPAADALSGCLAGLCDGAAGLVAGAVLGLLWRQALLRGGRQPGLVLGLTCVGLMLGWQAAVVLAVLTAVIHLGLSLLARFTAALRAIPPTIWLATGTLAWLLAWGALVARFPRLG